MIGAYGNAWIQTPTLDALTCQAVIFDRYYSDTMRLEGIFESFWRSSTAVIPEQIENKGVRTILLTDDDDVFHHSAADFTEKHRLELPKIDRPVEKIEETQFFQAFATIVDLLENRKEGNKSFFFWTHLQGFRGVWDFPSEYRERFRDEEDPAPYLGVAPPEIVAQAEKAIDPDDLQAVMEAYAGGISVLDDALAGLLDWFEESRLDKNTLLVFLSSRGFSLGEHGRIGPNEMLYGENAQLPLWVRFPDGFEAATRCGFLFKPSDLGDFLAATMIDESPFDDFKKRLQDLAESLREILLIGNSNEEQALLTDEWFLRKTGNRLELYAKPDDRWEVNDVADRCPDVVEELVAILEDS